MESTSLATAIAVLAFGLMQPVHGFAQDATDPARSSQPIVMGTAATQTTTGIVKSFTHAPTGEIDGFELDDGTTVHYPPTLQPAIGAAILRNNRVRVTGLVGPGLGTGAKPAKLLEAQTITNLATNQTLELERLLLDAPHSPAPGQPAGVTLPAQTRPPAPTDR
jgi:hypothetical protein